MTTRFILNTSELDDANVGLDGPSPAFILDTSLLDGDGKLDGVTFTTTATAAGALGGLTASATGTVIPVVTATAEALLGELFADVSDVTVTVDAEASASLGEATSSATGIVTHLGSGAASLGGLTAAATGTVFPFGSLTAELGPMVATAVGTITPQPSPVSSGGGRPNYRQPKRKKVQPVIVQEVVVESTVKVVEAFVTPLFVGFTATAQGSITFSAEDDDLQVMLML